MGLLIIAALLPVVIFWITLLTLSGQVVPVTPYKLIVDLLASLLITGCLVIFSNSRFADLLLGDVLRIYWSGYAALFAWLGSDFLIREARSRPLVVSAFYEVLGFLFVLFCMAAVFRGVDVAERTIARWFFDKPDYDQLLLSMCGAMLQSESEAEWSQHLARCLCEQAGFAAARLIKLAESKVDFSMLARPGQVELFPLPDNFLRFVTDPAADVLLPVRVQGEVVYILAIAASPVRGELLQIELTFLRRFVRHLEEQLELRRSASLRRERERHEEQLRAQLTESELRALRAQIQPHFLFNSLNTIAHLCIAEPSQAERMTTMLANIFRYVLTSTNDGFITLGEEIQFIENYLAIEQMRFGDRLKIELAVEPETRSFHVPPLILQPLIENAVRHGLAPQISGGLIRLSSWRSGATLEITVEDTGVGLGKAGVGHGSTRVGLANIRKRLECHYGSAASLQLSERQGGGVCAAISIGGSL
jgi:two-component system LytT family sensor kinase